MTKKIWKMLISMGILSAFSATQAFTAQSEPQIEPSSVMSDKAPRLTAEDLEIWLDGFMPLALEKSNAAGAVIAVVKDGKLLFSQGYGFADFEGRLPVDAQKTLFRPGSVSKLFTWTAVMQQVEAGLLDLDTDINTYLDFEVAPRTNTPITLRHIMTHTAGFEERIKNLITSSPGKANLGDTLKEWVPARVFEPGTTPAYSNYATALAGYIVERVTETPFERYVEENIFKPLEMQRSTFRQPLPAALSDDMSKGYMTANDGAIGFEYVSLPPAGSMSATAVDMSKFMIAHLQKGAYNGQRILKAETADLMHNSLTQLIPPLNGIRLGFYDQNTNGQHIISHGGDTQYFHSNLSLYMDAGVGIFLSINSSGVPGSLFRGPLLQAFADRYFPVELETPDYLENDLAKQHLALIAGDYIPLRRSFSNFMALPSFISPLSVVPNADGTISIPLLIDASGTMKKYRETEPFIWQAVNGQDRIRAIVENGQVVRMSADTVSPIIFFEKVSGLRAPSTILPLVLMSIAILALTVVQWPATALIRRNYGAQFTLTGARKHSYRLSRIFSILGLVAMFAWLMLAAKLDGPKSIEAISSSDGHILFASLLSVIGLFGGVLVSAWAAFTLFLTQSGWFAKLWCILLVGAFVFLTWLAVSANLIGFSTQF